MDYTVLTKILGVQKEFSSLEDFSSDPDVLSQIDNLIWNEWADEIARGNKRWIDKIIFDLINIYGQPKTYIFDWFMSKHATRTPCYMPDKVLHWDDFVIDEYYFDYDVSKKEELLVSEKKLPNLQIDQRLSDDIRRVICRTMSRFPELSDATISFVAVDWFKIMPNRQHVMRSQASIWDLVKELLWIKKRTTRTYVIQINTLRRDWVMVLHKLSDFSKWWVMTHEFAHTLDYTHKSVWWMLLFLLWFTICPRRVRHMERKIDETAIARGSWYGLYVFRREVHAWSSKQYARYKRRAYLWPREILFGILKHHKMYSSDVLNKVYDHISQGEY